MSTTSGRHVAPRAYPSGMRVMRMTMRMAGFALLGITGIAGYVLAAMTRQQF